MARVIVQNIVHGGRNDEVSKTIVFNKGPLIIKYNKMKDGTEEVLRGVSEDNLAFVDNTDDKVWKEIRSYTALR